MSFLYSVFNVPLLGPQREASGGDDRNRTDDPLLAGQVLSQLSYTPICGPLLPVLAGQFVKIGGLKWTRTTDLTLIRRAL